MKKIAVWILVAVLLCACSVNVCASSDHTYALSALGLKMSIPNKYSVITRNTAKTDPVFEKVGTTYADCMSLFEKSNIYLNAVDDSNDCEIVVTMTRNGGSNFSLLSDTELEIFAQSLAKGFDQYGLGVVRQEIYHHHQAKFIKIRCVDPSGPVYVLQYSTLYDGKFINITMRSYDGTLTTEQEKIMKVIIDGVDFDKDPPTVEDGKDTQSFLYTDTDASVSFFIPNDWEQKDFVQDREHIDVKFVSTKESSCTIIYGSEDVWGQMSASDRMGYTRSDLNNSAFSIIDIAQMYGVGLEKVSRVTYNGQEYFKAEVTASKNVSGMDIYVTMTQLLRFENGWLYSFQFSGTSSHKLYSDFESVLNSVQYSNVISVPNGPVLVESNVDSTPMDEELEEYMEDDTEAKPINGLFAFLPSIIFLFGPAVAGIIIAIVVKRRKAKQAEAITVPQVVFCSRCGRSLVAGTQFCNRCGSRVNGVSKLYSVQPMQLSANFTDDFGWRAELATLKSDEVYRRYCDAEEWSEDYRALCYQELVKRQETTSQS